MDVPGICLCTVKVVLKKNRLFVNPPSALISLSNYFTRNNDPNDDSINVMAFY